MKAQFRAFQAKLSQHPGFSALLWKRLKVQKLWFWHIFMHYGTHYSQNKQLMFRLLCFYIPITSVPKTWFQGVDSSLDLRFLLDSSLESVAGSDLFWVSPGSLGWRHCHLILLTSHWAAIWSWGVSTQAPVVTNRARKSVMMFLHIIVTLNNQGWYCLIELNPCAHQHDPNYIKKRNFNQSGKIIRGAGLFPLL